MDPVAQGIKRWERADLVRNRMYFEAEGVAGASANSGWTDIGPRSAFESSRTVYNPLGKLGPTIGHPQNVGRQRDCAS